MTPTHSEGRAAARRVMQANEDRCPADVRDSIMLSLYHLSCLVRELPERQRMAEAQRVARHLMANTRESLD